MANMSSPIIVVDFDGVIHSYERGWQKGRIYGTVVPGFFEWCEEAVKYFRINIYSSRSDSHKNIQPMKDWLTVHLQAYKWEHPDSKLDMNMFEFPSVKPPALVTIDDRAITFKGKWDAPELNPKTLIGFKPWNYHNVVAIEDNKDQDNKGEDK